MKILPLLLLLAGCATNYVEGGCGVHIHVTNTKGEVPCYAALGTERAAGDFVLGAKVQHISHIDRKPIGWGKRYETSFNDIYVYTRYEW